jgi:hypothetical protein
MQASFGIHRLYIIFNLPQKAINYLVQDEYKVDLEAKTRGESLIPYVLCRTGKTRGRKSY